MNNNISIHNSYTKYKTFKYKKTTKVRVKLQDGSGTLVLYKKHKKNFQKFYNMVNSNSFRNYKELLKLLKVDVIIISQDNFRLREIHNIIYKVSQILNMQKFKERYEVIKSEDRASVNYPVIKHPNTKFYFSKCFIVNKIKFK